MRHNFRSYLGSLSFNTKPFVEFRLGNGWQTVDVAFQIVHDSPKDFPSVFTLVTLMIILNQIIQLRLIFLVGF